MRSQGSAYGHFRRALTSGNSTLALVAAAELPQVTLEDALALCRLLAEQRDERYPRAAARWLQRFAAETTATLAEVQLAAASLARLQEEPGSAVAIETVERLAHAWP